MLKQGFLVNGLLKIELLTFIKTLALCIDNNDNDNTFVLHTVYLWPLWRHLHPRCDCAQMAVLGPQVNTVPSKSHVIVLLTFRADSCMLFSLSCLFLKQEFTFFKEICSKSLSSSTTPRN